MNASWAAVVGDPVSHSLSPSIFRLFSRMEGRPLRYYALTLRPEDLKGALASAKGRPWVGWSVTAPLKVEVLALVDSADETARDVGAANLIRFHQGRCLGYNTDVEGFLKPLSRLGFPLLGKRAAVLGAGGAARAACAALKRRGVGNLWILSRNSRKARALADAFSARSGGLSGNQALGALGEADLVVNATSAGMDGVSSPLPAGTRFKRGALAYDLSYRPRRTPFLSAAGDAGVETLGGLGMLVAQAAAAWKILFGRTLAEEVLERTENELMGRLSYESSPGA